MDMITLAMAKPKVIDLDAWGIDVVTPAFSGGGWAYFSDIDIEAFWKSIPTNGNFVLKMDVDGMPMIVTPVCSTSVNGVVGSVNYAMSVFFQGAVITVNVQIMNAGNSIAALILVDQTIAPEQ